MGGLFSKPKMPKPDTSALRAAEEARRKSQEAAALAEARKRAIEEENLNRKKQVSLSGRDSTNLTDDNKTLLGS